MSFCISNTKWVHCIYLYPCKYVCVYAYTYLCVCICVKKKKKNLTNVKIQIRGKGWWKVVKSIYVKYKDMHRQLICQRKCNSREIHFNVFSLIFRVTKDMKDPSYL